MDKELPWLADNAQLELKYKKGKTPLSHRNWPGEPVPVITESIIQTLGDELLQKAEKKKNIVWRYENFLLEWQSAITQAINLIGEHKPSIPARTMAALACIAQNDSQQLLDEIVQQEGLEYATDVVMARQCIARRYARLSIARSGCVNPTANRMKRSFTLTCIAGRRFAISCAIYIAALIYPAFRFLRR